MDIIVKNWTSFLFEGQDTRSVVKVVFVDGEGKILILKRSGKVVSKASPWEWDLPGGHMEEGERELEALKREVFEETKMTFEDPKRIYSQDGTSFFVCHNFDGTPDLSKEHDDFIWINPKNVSNYNIGSKYETAIKRALTK